MIVFPKGIPIEIQVRTSWQHEWAELFEKLADRVGRGIRYGDLPKRLFTQAEFDELPSEVRIAAAIFNRNRDLTVELARTVADLVSAVEQGQVEDPDAVELPGARAQAAQALKELRETLLDFDTWDGRITAAWAKARSRLDSTGL